jgi:tetratricopeptide (TPR) repeat protein
MQKEFERARADFDAVIRLDPKAVIRSESRGRAYAGLKEFDKALKDFGEAIRLDPKYFSVYESRGNVYFTMKDHENAVKDFRTAIELNPKSMVAHNNLAWLLATSPQESVRDGKKGVEVARVACELTGWKNPVAIRTLAAAYAESGMFPEAVKWEKKALGIGYRNEEETAKSRGRLKLYEDGKPFRLD